MSALKPGLAPEESLEGIVDCLGRSEMVSETAKKSTAAVLMTEMLASQVALAEKTRLRVAEKLEPILDPSVVPYEEESAKSEHEPWPSLFQEVRNGLEQIYEALAGINRVLDRCDI